MERKDALAELIAKVEAGDDKGFRAANRAVFSTPCQDMNLQLREENCRHAYKGSLDAAMALHEAVLPDAWVLLRVNGKYAHCTVDVDGEEVEANNQPDPARAWLIAILKALHAEETGT